MKDLNLQYKAMLATVSCKGYDQKASAARMHLHWNAVYIQAHCLASTSALTYPLGWCWLRLTLQVAQDHTH